MKNIWATLRRWTHLLYSKIRAAIELWIARRKFYSSLLKTAAKGFLSEQERVQIQERCDQLALSLDKLKGVRAKVYRKALQTARQSGHVTAEMENGLSQIQNFLMIPDGEIFREREDLSHLRLLAEIHDGNPPILHAVEIVLQKGEQAYWSEPAGILEQRVVGRRYEGGSQGVSIRIAKGVSYRVGSHRGRMVTDKRLLEVSSGSLIVTSKRVIFTGGLKSFDVKLDKVLSVHFADDGMIFTTGSREKPYVLQFRSRKNVEVVQAILDHSMKRFAA